MLAHLSDELGDGSTGVDDVHALAKDGVVDLVREDEHGSTMLGPEQLHVLRTDVLVHAGFPLAVVLRTSKVLDKHLGPVVVRRQLGPTKVIVGQADKGSDLSRQSVFFPLDLLINVGRAGDDEEVVLAPLGQLEQGRVHNLVACRLDIDGVVEAEVVSCTRQETVVVCAAADGIVAFGPRGEEVVGFEVEGAEDQDDESSDCRVEDYALRVREAHSERLRPHIEVGQQQMVVMSRQRVGRRLFI